MTIIEIKPFRNGWKCFEALGVERVFLDQEQAIDYAKGRACFRSGEIQKITRDLEERATCRPLAANAIAID